MPSEVRKAHDPQFIEFSNGDNSYSIVAAALLVDNQQGQGRVAVLIARYSKCRGLRSPLSWLVLL